MLCVDCKYYNKPEGETEFCGADLWDRDEDSYIKSDEDFEEYINKERLCTGFETNQE